MSQINLTQFAKINLALLKCLARRQTNVLTHKNIFECVNNSKIFSIFEF